MIAGRAHRAAIAGPSAPATISNAPSTTSRDAARAGRTASPVPASVPIPTASALRLHHQHGGVVVADPALEDFTRLDHRRLGVEPLVVLHGTDVLAVLHAVDEVADEVEPRDGGDVLDDEHAPAGHEEAAPFREDRPHVVVRQMVEE